MIKERVFGTQYWVPGIGCQVLGNKHLVPSRLVPSVWYQVLRGTQHVVPGAWSQVVCNKYLVADAWYQVFGIKYLVPGACNQAPGIR